MAIPPLGSEHCLALFATVTYERIKVTKYSPLTSMMDQEKHRDKACCHTQVRRRHKVVVDRGRRRFYHGL